MSIIFHVIVFTHNWSQSYHIWHDLFWHIVSRVKNPMCRTYRTYYCITHNISQGAKLLCPTTLGLSVLHPPTIHTPSKHIWYPYSKTLSNNMIWLHQRHHDNFLHPLFPSHIQNLQNKNEWNISCFNKQTPPPTRGTGRRLLPSLSLLCLAICCSVRWAVHPSAWSVCSQTSARLPWESFSCMFC